MRRWESKCDAPPQTPGRERTTRLLYGYLVRAGARNAMIEQMFAVVVQLAGEDVSELPEAALAEELVEIRQGIDRLEAEFARRLALFARRRGYAADGSLSLAAWLRHNCGMSFGNACEKAIIARQFDQLPATASAFAAGAFGYDSARILARTASLVGIDAYRPGEAAMVEAAQRLEPGQLRLAAAALRHCVDPDGSLADSEEAHSLRSLKIGTGWKGRYVVNGEFDPEGGAAIVEALNALIGPRCPDDERQPWQRRADALVELCRQRLDAGTLPEVAGQKPHLSLLVRSTDGGAGELEWGGMLPSASVLRLACDSALAVLVADVDGEPVATSNTVRTVPPSVRRALVARDRGCRFPGCDRPADWTDGHHLQHWARGGETKLRNLVLLCRRHHRRIHEGGWRLAWGDGGKLLASAP